MLSIVEDLQLKSINFNLLDQFRFFCCLKYLVSLWIGDVEFGAEEFDEMANGHLGRTAKVAAVLIAARLGSRVHVPTHQSPFHPKGAISISVT